MTPSEKPSQALVYNFLHSIDVVYKEIASESYLEDRATWVTTDEATATITPKLGGGVTIVLDRAVRRNYPKAFKGLFPAKTARPEDVPVAGLSVVARLSVMNGSNSPC